jgi:formamidopyrimidine-DNA glycosylase
MPELPDISLYLSALRPRILERTLERIAIRSPFLLRSTQVAPEECEGRRVASLEPLGKRIVIGLDGDLYLVLHLMIAGRLLWKEGRATPKGKLDLAAFTFDSGTLMLTEASTQKRASLHILRGRTALTAHDPGGLDPLTCTRAEFAAALQRERRTLKRALTSPRTFSGIGNAYSDEVLHAARLSPLQLTTNLTDDEAARLHAATRDTLSLWTRRLHEQFGVTDKDPGRFPGPGDITASRPDFAVHGRYGKPCPVCGTPVQRILYADNETNYCPRCQTAGKLLADRAMSRLLRDDWPRTIEEWEQG